MRPDRCRLERDLYRFLLELPLAVDLGPALRRALHLVVEATSAERGYLELYTPDSSAVPRWSISEGCSEQKVADIQRVTSRGIVASALASAKTIHTPSALLDERFDKLASVRDQRLEAILCVPIIAGGDPIGVLYLEAPIGPFSDEDVSLVESLSRCVGPVVDRLVASELGHGVDHTASWRKELLLEGVAGRSEALARVFREVSLWAPRDFTVLITGPSGSGKNMLARAIHANSPRRNGPLCEVSCATLPDQLVESELFGALPGGHSTATQRMHGKVEAAEGGTLFLDEIGELPLPAQAKLLQLLQSREYFPLGGHKPVRANIRIIAATNQDLEEMVRERRFREDLLFRINLATIRVPPLSERPDDVLPLAEFLVDAVAERERLPALRFSPAACRALLSADWPGNVRTLEAAVSRGLVNAVHEGATQIEVDHLFNAPAHGSASPDDAQTFQQATRAFQRDLVARTLTRTNWNIAETARLLDITRSHVYNLIRVHQLNRDS